MNRTFAITRTSSILRWRVTQDNEAWLVMDFVGGGSVCDILEACEVILSEGEARECAAWTVLALDYLHSNRKLHRVSGCICVATKLSPSLSNSTVCTLFFAALSTICC